MKAEAQKEHQWLQKLLGEWSFEGECPSEPGGAPLKFEGSETVRSIGELWVLAEGRGTMPGGGPALTVTTLGYDPLKKAYVGTWVGSMMSHLWVYRGSLDASGKVLALDAEGPDFANPEKSAKYQDGIELVDDDHRVLTGRVLGDDGSWRVLMTARYRRKG